MTWRDDEGSAVDNSGKVYDTTWRRRCVVKKDGIEEYGVGVV
jgi:hypothetical protein